VLELQDATVNASSKGHGSGPVQELKKPYTSMAYAGRGGPAGIRMTLNKRHSTVTPAQGRAP